MKMHTLSRVAVLRRPIGEVFAFYTDAANLELITPPWLGFRILTPVSVRMARGARIDYRIRLHGIPLGWKTEITRWEPPHLFVDVQLRGPYRRWEHTHEFVEVGGGTEVRDRVSYAVWGGWPGEWVRRAFIAPDLERIFDYRERVLAERFNR